MLSVIKNTVRYSLNLAASQFGPQKQNTTTPQLWVLMYHRILPTSDPRFQLEEPGMVVTPESLDMHLAEAKKLFTMVALKDWVTKAKAGEPLPAKACAITFDDGWLDNHEFAIPVLEKHNTPATIFVVADKVGTQFRFWPNIVSELIHNKSAALANHPLLEGAFKATQAEFSREELARCIDLLKQHSEIDIFNALEAIDWQSQLAKSPAALMNWPQITALEANPLIDIESHTCTHQRLNKGLNEHALEQEILGSKNKIAQQLGKPVSYFCFPNGDYNNAALKLVQQGYTAAVTTQRGINTLNTMNFHEIKRVPIHNDGTDTPLKFRAKLACWR